MKVIAINVWESQPNGLVSLTIKINDLKQQLNHEEESTLSKWVSIKKAVLEIWNSSSRGIPRFCRKEHIVNTAISPNRNTSYDWVNYFLKENLLWVHLLLGEKWVKSLKINSSSPVCVCYMTSVQIVWRHLKSNSVVCINIFKILLRLFSMRQ